MPRLNTIGKPFIELSEVDSSNNYAMGQVQAQMAEHGTTWFAWHQNAGKGQRGKTWNTERGKNIIISTVIQPSFVLGDNYFLLSMMAALSCYDFFSSYALDETKIKWPNDIYWRDRKAGGILIENIVNGKNLKFSVIGIGININQISFPTALYNPVSLKQITGKKYNVIDLAKELCICIETRWQQLQTNSPDLLLKEYCSHLYKLNEQVTLKKTNALISGKIHGVTADGDLLVNGEPVKFGTVEWVIDLKKLNT